MGERADMWNRMYGTVRSTVRYSYHTESKTYGHFGHTSVTDKIQPFFPRGITLETVHEVTEINMTFIETFGQPCRGITSKSLNGDHRFFVFQPAVFRT